MKLLQGMRQRDNGRIEYRFTVDGKRCSVYGETVEECLKKEQEKRLYNDYKRGRIKLDAKFDDYYKIFYRRRAAVVKPNTIRQNLYAYNHYIQPYFGKMMLSEISRSEIEDFKTVLSKLKARTANMILSHLLLVLQEADFDDYEVREGYKKIKFFKITEVRATMGVHRALSREEQLVFEQMISGDWYEEIFLFMLLTGVRPGEAVALQWEDIDFKKRLIHICRTVTYTEDGQPTVGTPKTKASDRYIPMNDDICGVLNRQKTKDDFVYSIERFVFLTHKGTPMSSVSFLHRALISVRRRYAKKLAKSGDSYELEWFAPHALRDTFATRFVENGGNMKALQYILGHADFSMTSNLYSQAKGYFVQEEMNSANILNLPQFPPTTNPISSQKRKVSTEVETFKIF